MNSIYLIKGQFDFCLEMYLYKCVMKENWFVIEKLNLALDECIHMCKKG